MSRKWIHRVAKEIHKNTDNGNFQIHPEDVSDVNLVIFTVKDGIFKDQTHIFSIKWERKTLSGEVRRYPIYPPMCTFLTPIYHPNVNTNGVICVSLLNEDGDGAWVPSYGIDAIYNSIILLLNTPDVDSPLNDDAARDFTEYSAEQYQSIAQKYYEDNVLDIDTYKIIS